MCWNVKATLHLQWYKLFWDDLSWSATSSKILHNFALQKRFFSVKYVLAIAELFGEEKNYLIINKCSVHVRHLLSSFVDVIHGWNVQMKTFIHRWNFSIHGWHFHPWVGFLHLLKTTRDDTFICVWHPFVTCFWMNSINQMKTPSIDENVIHDWRNLILEWKQYPWISSMDGENSSMDESVILRYLSWTKSIDEDERW